MSLNEETELLAKVPIFSKIDPSKRGLLAFTSKRLVFEVGHDLFRAGDQGDAAYVIIDGEAEVLIAGKGGEVRVARLGKHDLIGEIAILIDIPRTATVRAATELTVLKISKDQFLQMLMDFPEIAIEVARELAHRLAFTTSKLKSE